MAMGQAAMAMEGRKAVAMAIFSPRLWCWVTAPDNGHVDRPVWVRWRHGAVKRPARMVRYGRAWQCHGMAQVRTMAWPGQARS
jgi:hypothetical protein